MFLYPKFTCQSCEGGLKKTSIVELYMTDMTTCNAWPQNFNEVAWPQNFDEVGWTGIQYLETTF